ncbi:MAG: methionine--tRNA ligase [Candidatus Hodarchaeales archaeon]
MAENKEKFIVTSALPYVNGIKHLGNFIGSLLPADIYSRYLRAQGHDVLSICATDEHGTPAELAALEEGLSVEDYCLKYYKIQKKIYEDFLCSYDYFGRTSDQANHKMTQHLFMKLYENELIEERETTQLYSKTDQRFLPDRFVRGICPYCDYDNARGDQCENCTKVLDPLDLKEPRSAISGSNDVEQRKVNHLYINLPKMESKIGQWIESKKNRWSRTSYSIARKWLNEGLQSRSITRDLKWGIKVPLEGFEDKVFYVWFDAPIGYIGASIQWAEASGKSWEHYWKDPKTKLIQFMGKDNVPFHTVTWPSTMMGAADGFVLADMVKGFQWLNFEGGKFSTSQNRGVFTDQALKIFPPDHWRYYLNLIAPERHDTDFLWSGFQSAVNNDLANVLGNFVHRTLTFIIRYFDGTIPTQTNQEPLDENIIKKLDETIINLKNNFEKVEFQKALLDLRSFWQACNQYFQAKKPWEDVKNNKERAGTTLSIAAHLSRAIAILSQVYIPQTANDIFKYLGIQGKVDKTLWDQSADFKILKGKTLPPNPKPLFTKIDNKMIKKLVKQFGGSEEGEQKVSDVKGRVKKKKKITPKKLGIITFEEFKNVQIKIGEIKSGERVPDSKKLLQFEVDIGESKGNRQIIAGLGEYYDPTELLNKKVLVVTNLETKKLAGLDSQGMILAYDGEKDKNGKISRYYVVIVDDSATIGSSIS